MRVLLINRYDFIDGGADRVFLNTYDLLTQSAPSYPSLPKGGAGEGTSEAGEGTSGAGEGTFEVDTFTQKDLGISTPLNPRSLSFSGKLKLVRDYLYNKKVAKALDQKIRDFRPDVAHVHLIFGTLSVSVLRVLKKHKVPVVMTLHDYRLICPANAFLDRNGAVCEKCKSGRYYNCLINRCSGGNLFYSFMIMLEGYMRKYVYRPLNLVDHFIFVSEFARKKHFEYDPRYAKKSSHLYNMANPVEESFPTRGNYFLYFGRLSREKGLLTLIAAAKLTNINLIIAGTGPQEAELLNLIPDTRDPIPSSPIPDTRYLIPKILLVGFVSGPALKDLIAGCSFVLVPSEWYENNPMAVVEAFTLGKPVIGSRIGGIPELLVPETGFLFEPRNVESLVEALKKAMAVNDKEYLTLANSCRDFAVQNFDRKVHLNRLVGIYQQVLHRA